MKSRYRGGGIGRSLSAVFLCVSYAPWRTRSEKARIRASLYEETSFMNYSRPSPNERWRIASATYELHRHVHHARFSFPMYTRSYISASLPFASRSTNLPAALYTFLVCASALIVSVARNSFEAVPNLVLDLDWNSIDCSHR